MVFHCNLRYMKSYLRAHGITSLAVAPLAQLIYPWQVTCPSHYRQVQGAVEQRSGAGQLWPFWTLFCLTLCIKADLDDF